MEKEDLCLVVMDNCTELGDKINQAIQSVRGSSVDYRVAVNIARFSDGEAKASILSSIRGKDVYIISDTHNYSLTYKMYNKEQRVSPDDHFMDIIRVISAMMGHAKNIHVVMPLLYESRQHRRKSRESLDCAVALQILKNLGVTEIITVDVHDPNVQNAIPTLSFDNIFPTNDMLKLFLANEKIDLTNTLVISPDTGAMDRARFFAKVLNTDVGVFYKQRDVSKVVDGKNPIVDHKYLGSDLTGKIAMVVDDMIASGGSMLEVAEEIKKRGASKVFFFASFALFTEGVEKFDKAYENGLFDAVYATNLNYVPSEILSKSWFNSVDCSIYLAKVIDCLNKGDSLGQLMEDNSAVTNYNNMKKIGEKEDRK